MKIISLKAHGILDFVTVAAFAIIPTVVGLSGIPAILCYVLSAVHFLMTILTDFPFGLIRVLPVRIHKFVESVVGPTLLVMPWLLGFSGDPAARYVFIAAGLVVILVGLLSDYFETGKRSACA